MYEEAKPTPRPRALRAPEDPEVVRAQARRYYHSNKQKYYEKNRQRRLSKEAAIRDLKAVPCMDCGVQYPPYVMDFDHRPGEVKLFNVSGARRCLRVMLEEIAKCDVVCSNCHRERTWGVRP